MKKTMLVSAVLLALSSNSFATEINTAQLEEIQNNAESNMTTQMIDPITMSTVGGWILSGAKSAIKNGVKSFLKDALFGSAGPSYVMLHEDSLRQIEDIVTEVVINSDVEDAKSILYSFDDLLGYYHASAQNNEPDISLLPALVTYATSLKNHQAYRTSYNSNAHLLTGSYSLVSALTIAVLAEKEIRGDISHAYVKSVANSLKTTLNSLGAQADSYVRSNIRITPPSGNCDGIIIHSVDPVEESALINEPGFQNNDDTFILRNCTYTVRDSIASKTYTYKIANYGPNLASRLAYNKYNALQSDYADKFKGTEFATIVNELATY